MKILITTFTFPPSKDGVSEAARAMAEGLAERGWDVVVATSYDPSRLDFSPMPNLRIMQFHVGGHPLLKGGVSGQVEEYKRLLEEENPDYLVCHCGADTWPTCLALSVFPRMRAVKIQISHGFSLQCWKPVGTFPWGLGYWLRFQPLVWFLPLILWRFDALVFLSQQRDWNRFFDHTLARLFCHPRVEVIPNGTDLRAFDLKKTSFRERFGIGLGPMLLCVANFSTRKNQEVAIRAFHRLEQTEASLVLVGSEFNEYSSYLLKLVGDLFPGNERRRVFMMERLSREDVLEAYLECDMTLLSAREETQPIVLIESMAAGKPWISTDTGCVRNLPGGVVVSGETEMTEMMRQMLDKPDWAAELGRQGRRAAEAQYNWGRVLDAQEKLLLSLQSRVPAKI
ncbi:MAG: glycosyltransferase family 4 protein [Candidatus Methylacidiphilales bacterium]|nr:glycosyltransferase family 4 protein [Candidatus Methylacidiphilales bacterium]